jgi:hypothetical protein
MSILRKTIHATETSLPAVIEKLNSQGFFQVSPHRYVRLSDGHSVIIQLPGAAA